jgi:hypothetical protein
VDRNERAGVAKAGIQTCPQELCCRCAEPWRMKGRTIPLLSEGQGPSGPGVSCGFGRRPTPALRDRGCCGAFTPPGRGFFIRAHWIPAFAGMAHKGIFFQRSTSSLRPNSPSGGTTSLPRWQCFRLLLPRLQVNFIRVQMAEAQAFTVLAPSGRSNTQKQTTELRLGDSLKRDGENEVRMSTRERNMKSVCSSSR